MTPEVDQLIKFIMAIGGVITLLGGGVWWLVQIAIGKGTTQAHNLSSQMEMIGKNINDKIEANDRASRDRHEETNRRLSEHNQNIAGQLDDIKAQQNRQLDYIKTVDNKTIENTTVISKVSNRVSSIEGRMSVVK